MVAADERNGTYQSLRHVRGLRLAGHTTCRVLAVLNAVVPGGSTCRFNSGCGCRPAGLRVACGDLANAERLSATAATRAGFTGTYHFILTRCSLLQTQQPADRLREHCRSLSGSVLMLYKHEGGAFGRAASADVVTTLHAHGVPPSLCGGIWSGMSVVLTAAVHVPTYQTMRPKCPAGRAAVQSTISL